MIIHTKLSLRRSRTKVSYKAVQRIHTYIHTLTNNFSSKLISSAALAVFVKCLYMSSKSS